jgi:hypothetical protein
LRGRFYKPSAVRRGANDHQTPHPAWLARGLAAGRLSLATHSSAMIVCMTCRRRFELCLSVALYVKSMDALSRPENLPPGITPAEAVAFLRYLAGLCHVQPIYFL